MTPAAVLLALVTFSRLSELWLARRNTARLLASGGVEVAPGHYPFIVLMHASWLAALWVLGRNNPLDLFWLGTLVALQAGRGWVLWTLGPRWTTRIITLPGETLVSTGPFRFLRHPNYAVVIGEIAVLPLCLGLPWVALIFTVLNALVLSVRISAENAGLAEARSHVTG